MEFSDRRLHHRRAGVLSLSGRRWFSASIPYNRSVSERMRAHIIVIHEGHQLFDGVLYEYDAIRGVRNANDLRRKLSWLRW